MGVETIFDKLTKEGCDFFTGVPDSALKDFQDDIIKSDLPHIPAVHESQAIAIAFGALLAGKKPCVYLQNSGLGNTINPLTSLCMPFGLNPLLVIGHRHTLPQHKIMGEADKDLLGLIGYKNYFIIEGNNNVK
jgi:phosphonopyruvate decarboxylase